MKYAFLQVASVVLLQAVAICRADEITIKGTTGPLRWEPAEVKVKPGDVVTWVVAKGGHGLVFNDFDAAQQVLTIDPKSLPIVPQRGFPAPAKGTGMNSSATFLVKATIKAIPAGMTEVCFVCTAHPDDMAGKLILHASADGARPSAAPAPDKAAPEKK